MADDMALWAMSAESSISNAYTPELDKLASARVYFKNLFAVSANCTPSRVSLHSGRYPSETQLTDLIARSPVDGLPLDKVIFAEVFKDEGYNTAFLGKWHLGEEDPVFRPTNRGYDLMTGLGPAQSKSPTLMVGDTLHTFEGEYTSDLLTDISISYIEELNPKKTGKPFLLSLNYWAPHTNTSFPEGMEPEHDDRSWLPIRDVDLAYWDTLSVKFPDPNFPNLDSQRLDRFIREYHASAHSVDRNIARIIEYLNKKELIDNTIVIFTSENGYMSGHNGLWHKGRGWWMTKDQRDPYGIFEGWPRLNLYDNTMRVPGIIYWPSVIDESIKITEVVNFLDWFPTLLSMAGIERKEEWKLKGRNMIPLINQEDIEWDNDVYMKFSYMRGFRTPEWKLNLDFSDNAHHELFNLQKDPEEKKSL